MNANNTSSQPQESSNQTPAHVCDSGRVRASIWHGTANNEPVFKITITRSYKRENEWMRSHTYFAEELSAVVEVAARAQRWIERQKREQQQPELAAA